MIISLLANCKSTHSASALFDQVKYYDVIDSYVSSEYATWMSFDANYIRCILIIIV